MEGGNLKPGVRSSSSSRRVEDTPHESEISGLLPIEVIFEHIGHGTASIHSVEFPIKTPVEQLKQDMSPRLKTSPDCQEWYYKSKKMTESDSLFSLQIRRDDKILIKEITAGKRARIKQPASEEEHKLSEASGSQ